MLNKIKFILQKSKTLRSINYQIITHKKIKFITNLTIQENSQPDFQAVAHHLEALSLFQFPEVFHPHLAISHIHSEHLESIC
jgi:hypothetical protein